MDKETVRKHWNKNAETWTKLSRAGYDTYRNHLNTPAFMAMLPEIQGLTGLDIGCGEGYNTRLLAHKGARMVALDLSDIFIREASTFMNHSPKVPKYLVADACQIPFASSIFDFATGFMSFMDSPRPERVLREAWRVIKPGGFLQFSISHPCFDTAFRKNLRDENGHTYAFEIGGYFRHMDGEVSDWIFSAAPAEVCQGLHPFSVPGFARPLNFWINTLIDLGFVIEHVEEPCPDDDTVNAYPNLQDAQVIAYFLIVRARKPAARD